MLTYINHCESGTMFQDDGEAILAVMVEQMARLPNAREIYHYT